MGKLVTLVATLLVVVCTLSHSATARFCDGIQDDTAAFLSKLASGQTLRLPAGTCMLNTFGFGTVNILAPGTGYHVNDLEHLANGIVFHVAEVQITGVSIVGAGTGCTNGGQLTLVGGVSDAPALLTITSVGGGGAVTGVSVLNGGAYTSQPGSFSSTGGQCATTPTFNTPVWGIAEVPLNGSSNNNSVYPVTSTVANPVAESSTSGSGSGATFEVMYTAVPLTANGQCILGQDLSQTFISTTRTQYNLITASAIDNCVGNLTFKTPAMIDGWPLHAYNAFQCVFFNLGFTTTPGAVAFTHGSSGCTLKGVRINSCIGGAIKPLVPTASGALIAEIVAWGDVSNSKTLNGTVGTTANTGPNFLDDVIMSCGTTIDVIGLYFDGHVNSWDNSILRMNGLDTALVQTDSGNTQTGPNQNMYFDIQSQSPAATILSTAAFTVNAGFDTQFSNIFVNASGGDCFFIGGNVRRIGIHQASFSGCANNGLEIAGQNVSVYGNVITNANLGATCATCANVKLDVGANNVVIAGLNQMGGTNTTYDFNASTMTNGIVYSVGNVLSATTPINDPHHVISQNASAAPLTNGPYSGSGANAIPACVASLQNTFASVSDGKASPTANTAYAAADGVANQPVWCNGTTWLYMM